MYLSPLPTEVTESHHLVQSCLTSKWLGAECPKGPPRRGCISEGNAMHAGWQALLLHLVHVWPGGCGLFISSFTAWMGRHAPLLDCTVPLQLPDHRLSCTTQAVRATGCPSALWADLPCFIPLHCLEWGHRAEVEKGRGIPGIPAAVAAWVMGQCWLGRNTGLHANPMWTTSHGLSVGQLWSSCSWGLNLQGYWKKAVAYYHSRGGWRELGKALSLALGQSRALSCWENPH